jgi:hypothetical protein
MMGAATNFFLDGIIHIRQSDLCSLSAVVGGTPQQESLIIPWNGWLSHFALTPCFASLGEARPWAPLRVRLANRCPDSLPSPFHADAQGPSQMLAVPEP